MINQGDPLAELRDIHLPEAVSLWPLAPGWWLLLALIAAVLGLSIAVWLRRYRANLYRRQALLQLQTMQTSGSPEASALLALLKRTADTAYPQRGFSSLSLAQFLEFLEQSGPNAKFSQSLASLETGLYSSDERMSSADTQLLVENTRIWINQHVNSAELEYQYPC